MLREVVAGVAVAGAAFVLAACDERVRVRSDRDVQAVRAESGQVRAVSRLDCPERQGELRRTEAAPDGFACTYVGDRGTEVRLQLAALNGRTASEVLAPYEAELKTLMPAAAADQERALAAHETALAEHEAMLAEHEAALAADGVEIDADGDGDRARIRLPGVSIDADGENARVRIGNNLHIDADEADSVVRIRSDDETVNVRTDGDDRAEIRADAGEDGAVRSTYILTSDTPSAAGYRLVGYEARGPAAGPVVVAVVKAKSRRSDDAFDAMKALVERNAGN